MDSITPELPKITDRTFSFQRLFGKKQHSHSSLVFNERFYLQIRNPFEETCCDYSDKRIQPYGKTLEFLPSDNEDYVILENLQSILEVLLYIQIPWEQFIPFVFQQFRVYSIEPTKELNSLKTDFVSRFIIPFIASQLFLDNPSHQKQFEDQMKQYCENSNKIWIHENLFKLKFDPIDKEVAMEALHSNNKEYFKAYDDSYIQWKAYKKIVVCKHETIFQEKNEYFDDEFTNSDSVQQFINNRINDEKFYDNFLYSDWKIEEPKQLQIEGYTRPRIQLEMRKQAGKLRLATQCSNLEFLPYIKIKFYEENIKVHQVMELSSNIEGSNSLLIYIDIKEMSLNFDYDIIEKIFKLPNLANYLRSREVYFNEDRLTLKKGIILGEVYHQYLLQLFSSLIKSRLKLKLKQLLLKIGSYKYHDLHYYKDDFLFHVPNFSFGELSKSQVQTQVESIMKEFEITLNGIGFQMNKSKSRILYSQKDQPSQIWKMNSENSLEVCDDFIVFKKSLLKANQEQEEKVQESMKQKFKEYSEKIQKQYSENHESSNKSELENDIEEYVLKNYKNSIFFQYNQLVSYSKINQTGFY